MRVGTKSVLFGAHCFFIHPFFVAFGWWIAWGFPWDPRLWAAFFLHDLGYLSCPNVEGPEGGSTSASVRRSWVCSLVAIGRSLHFDIRATGRRNTV
jgi:hypothetical protein